LPSSLSAFPVPRRVLPAAVPTMFAAEAAPSAGRHRNSRDGDRKA
jgi:hypothetical protein